MCFSVAIITRMMYIANSKGKSQTFRLHEHYYSLSLKKWGLYWICLVLPAFCGSVIIQMKLEYLWGQLANLDHILYEASLGWRKGCIRFWDRLNQNSGFQGNRKCPLTYNGENVSIFSLLFFIRFFSNLQVTRTGIKSWMGSNFVQMGPLPTVRCPWASDKFPIDL